MQLDGLLRLVQYIDGNWVDLIDLELQKPAEKFENITDAISEVIKLIHDADSVFLTNSNGDSIVAMKSQGPIKLKFIPK
jgi:hypothetical protein